MKRRYETRQEQEDEQRRIDFQRLIDKKKNALSAAEHEVEELRSQINSQPPRKDLHLLLYKLNLLIKQQHDDNVSRPSSAPSRLNEYHTVDKTITPQRKNIDARVEDIEYTLKKKGTLFYRGNALTSMTNRKSEFTHKFSRGLFLTNKENAERYTGIDGNMDEYELIRDVSFFKVTPNNISILIDMILTVSEKIIFLRFAKKGNDTKSSAFTIENAIKIVEGFLSMTPDNRTDFAVDTTYAYKFCELCAYFGFQGVNIKDLNYVDGTPYGDIYFLSFPRLFSRVRPIENRLLFPGLNLKTMQYIYTQDAEQRRRKYDAEELKQYIKLQMRAEQRMIEQGITVDELLASLRQMYNQPDKKKILASKIASGSKTYNEFFTMAQLIGEKELIIRGIITREQILSMTTQQRVDIIRKHLLSDKS